MNCIKCGLPCEDGETICTICKNNENYTSSQTPNYQNSTQPNYYTQGYSQPNYTQGYNQSYGYNPAYGYQVDDTREEPMSIKDWLKVMLILCIPIANIVMLCVWGFSNNENKSRANFCKAYLIWMAIMVGVAIVMWIGMFSLIFTMV